MVGHHVSEASSAHWSQSGVRVKMDDFINYPQTNQGHCQEPSSTRFKPREKQVFKSIEVSSRVRKISFILLSVTKKAEVNILGPPS